MLQKTGYRPNLSTWDFQEVQPLYDVITVLRILGLKGQDRQVYEQMQDHLDEWTQRPDFMDKFRLGKHCPWMLHAMGIRLG